jgi:hypothetical protein
MRLAPLASSLAVATLALGSAHAQGKPDTDLRAHLTMFIGADGVPSDIKVTGASPDIGALVYKRVKEWKFKPAQWQGKPVPVPFSGWLKLDAQSNRSGGFTMHMSSLEGGSGGDSSETPTRSEDLGGGKFLTHVVFGYVVNLRTDGTVESIQSVLPRRAPPMQAQGTARNIESMLKLWRGSPSNVDGQRVACSRLYLEEHKPDLSGRNPSKGYRGWAETADLAALPADVAQAVQEELAALDQKGTRCPAPVLETKVAGVVL